MAKQSICEAIIPTATAGSTWLTVEHAQSMSGQAATRAFHGPTADCGVVG
jgi:hypothetical protein